MGGEPTFVGLDEPESPQWNIEALGPRKRACGVWISFELSGKSRRLELCFSLGKENGIPENRCLDGLFTASHGPTGCLYGKTSI